MLKVIRSTNEKEPIFQKGDRLLSSNVCNGYVEYLIDRPVVTYTVKIISGNETQYIRVEDAKLNNVGLKDNPIEFKSMKKVKEFIYEWCLKLEIEPTYWSSHFIIETFTN